MSVSTHVLDTTRGRPAKGVPVTLSHRGTDRRWTVVGRGVTDADGRVRELAEGGVSFGEYRLSSTPLTTSRSRARPSSTRRLQWCSQFRIHASISTYRFY